MARHEQLIRQHKLLQLLEDYRFGRTAEEFRSELVADLGLSTLSARTVRRDIEALQRAGYDIQSETLQHGHIYKLGRANQPIHEIACSPTELIALSIGRDLLLPLLGTQYWQGIETFWNKVQEAIPESVYEHYQRFRSVLFVHGTPAKTYAKQSGILKSINRAILEHRVVEINYQPVGRDCTQRRIEPYGLAVHQNSIYVVAAAPEVSDPTERLRNWKLDRFAAANVTDDRFEPDAKIDVSKFLSKSIGIFSGDSSTPVTIQLGQRSAAYVREDPWHPNQTLEPNADQPNTFTLMVPASHPREILPRVLSLGADAEVISPPEYRQTVADAVDRLASRYAANDAIQEEPA